VDGSEARDGHYVTINVDGQFDGETKPTHEEDVTLIIGHPQTNAEFSSNLSGARAGEMRTFDVSYPADYHRKRFAGKTVHYTVTVKDIKEKVLAELNDDFAKDVGSDNLEALRIKVRDELVTQAKGNAEKKAREELLDSIVQRQTLEVPECLVEDELEAHTRRIVSNLAYQGIDINQTAIDWKKILIRSGLGRNSRSAVSFSWMRSPGRRGSKSPGRRSTRSCRRLRKGPANQLPPCEHSSKRRNGFIALSSICARIRRLISSISMLI